MICDKNHQKFALSSESMSEHLSPLQHNYASYQLIRIFEPYKNTNVLNGTEGIDKQHIHNSCSKLHFVFYTLLKVIVFL